jgi:hypothetical protein
MLPPSSPLPGQQVILALPSTSGTYLQKAHAAPLSPCAPAGRQSWGTARHGAGATIMMFLPAAPTRSAPVDTTEMTWACAACNPPQVRQQQRHLYGTAMRAVPPCSSPRFDELSGSRLPGLPSGLHWAVCGLGKKRTAARQLPGCVVITHLQTYKPSCPPPLDAMQHHFAWSTGRMHGPAAWSSGDLIKLRAGSGSEFAWSTLPRTTRQ